MVCCSIINVPHFMSRWCVLRIGKQSHFCCCYFLIWEGFFSSSSFCTGEGRRGLVYADRFSFSET
ncbi:hypothetical protein RchiOBHm_Chr1g0325911 [Rosa chinensis]|uniref:Uncharacterized protein n=1 Tax=Rosa chinensis TaxID=74649 RepID=A0A2P6SA66_ROSCH|nr:hypothetical protein RchiOBHm_Chr1g0325911 [Rosa chinensis]